MKNIRVALDAMGGDHGPCVVVPAALDALMEFPELHIVLVGKKKLICDQLAHYHHQSVANRLEIHHTDEMVDMDDSPSTALRSKKKASMRLAIDLVHEKKAHACVSAGNTGALMAIARFVLRTLPGIDRPAIVYSMPTQVGVGEVGFMRVLDLGANVDCQGEHLFQFAVMGSELAAAVDNIAYPRVGLLNIGSEAIKGCEAVKQAAVKLQDTHAVNYVGFIEGTDMYHGKVDVVVCDGFVGNVALKTSEGVASFIIALLRKEFSRNIYTRIAALMVKPILGNIKKVIDPAGYNGASFLGLNGIVIKSHGNAERASFKHAILEAVMEVDKNVSERIRSKVASHLT